MYNLYMKNITNKNLIKRGFTLVELLVVMAIIGILSGIVFANFADARATSRDQARKVALKEVQLAIELYKAQEERYPTAGCGASGWTSASCDEYIEDLVPDYIPSLPKDPKNGNSYRYHTNGSGSAYKLIADGTVEKNLITSYSDEFARCPEDFGSSYCGSTPTAKTYAVYGGSASAQW
jgi:general secretion pathway protein G